MWFPWVRNAGVALLDGSGSKVTHAETVPSVSLGLWSSESLKGTGTHFQGGPTHLTSWHRRPQSSPHGPPHRLPLSLQHDEDFFQ